MMMLLQGHHVALFQILGLSYSEELIEINYIGALETLWPRRSLLRGSLVLILPMLGQDHPSSILLSYFEITHRFLSDVICLPAGLRVSPYLFPMNVAVISDAQEFLLASGLVLRHSYRRWLRLPHAQGSGSRL
jgi:hypothetical protein